MSKVTFDFNKLYRLPFSKVAQPLDMLLLDEDTERLKKTIPAYEIVSRGVSPAAAEILSKRGIDTLGEMLSYRADTVFARKSLGDEDACKLYALQKHIELMFESKISYRAQIANSGMCVI